VELSLISEYSENTFNGQEYITRAFGKIAKKYLINKALPKKE
jgi:hypothetical protein